MMTTRQEETMATTKRYGARCLDCATEIERGDIMATEIRAGKHVRATGHAIDLVDYGRGETPGHWRYTPAPWVTAIPDGR